MRYFDILIYVLELQSSGIWLNSPENVLYFYDWAIEVHGRLEGQQDTMSS